MANYKPNYYGPVPIATTGNTAANGATAGMLGCLVQQSSSQTVSTNTVGPEGTELTEVFKGPTAVLKDIIARKNSTAYGIWKVGQPRPTSNKIISRFTQPTPFDTYSWLISNIEIQQQEAGDHSLMTVKYKQILKDDIDPDGGGVIVHEDSTSWDLTWGSNNINIFAFCNTLSANRPKRIQFINTDIPGTEIDNDYPSEYANPENIINYAQSLNINSPVHLEKYQWVQGNYKVELNPHEREIYEKYAASASPIYHYPIITKTQNIYTTKNNVNDIKNKFTGYVDSISTPTGCPVFPPHPGTYEWLKVGENVYFSANIDGNNTNLFTINESWWGSVYNAESTTDSGWDNNFYGSGDERWKLGGR